MGRRRHAPQGRTRPALGLTVLSLLLALFLAAPASAQYEPPKQMTLSPLGVDLSDGRFSYKATDLSIGPFTLERSFLGGHTIDGSNFFGPNWTHNYAIYLVEKSRIKTDGIYIVLGRGLVHFTASVYSPTGYACVNPDCDGATLAVVNGAFVYTDAQGNVYTFNASVNAFPPYSNIAPPLRNPRIARIDHADGHSLTYTYSGQQLRQIASNYGYSLVFDYAGAGNSVAKACGYNRAVTQVTDASTCDGAALAVSYSYAANGNLANVVDVMGRSWGYDYGAQAMQLTCVRQVDTSACQVANAYASGGRPREVSQQTTPDGAVWNYNYQPVDPEYGQLPGQPPAPSYGSFTGPEGIQAGADFGGGLLNVYNQNGRQTALQWDGIQLQRLTHPEGNEVTYGWRAGEQVAETWQAKPNSGVAAVSRSSGFAEGTNCPTLSRKLCNKPVWREDYRGNRTTYTYAPHGGVETETGPLAGGVQPQMRTEYAAKRAWVSNGAGSVPEAVWIHLPVRKAFCATGAASGWGCAIAGDEVVTTYDYGPDGGPNTLGLRGQAVSAGAVTLRTCYAYDPLGRRISETGPGGTAGLAACPASPPATALPYTTSTRYDAGGKVTGTIAPDPDGPSGPLPHPAIRNSYDPAGRLVKVEKGALDSWQGEAVAPALWTGFAVHGQVDTAYDAMNRKTRDTASGGGIVSGVTEYSYDLAGRLRCTAVRMNPDYWTVPLADKCVPGPAHAVHGPDRITRNSYTVHGELLTVERAVGTPLQQVYASYTYSPNGKATGVTDANGNRAEMSWDGLDRQKRWIFPSKTAAGAVNPDDYEEYDYDANANRTSLRKRDTKRIDYVYDALNRMSQKTVPTSATGAAGYNVFYGYDNRGLQTFARFGSASGLGVTNSYDGFGRLASSATSMDGVSRSMASLYDAGGNRTLLTGDQGYSASFAYDGLDRMSAYVGAVQIGYDNAGRRSSLTMGPGSGSSSVGYVYDPAGRLRTLAHELAGTGGDQTLSFAYNPASQIVSRSTTNDAYASNTAYSVNRSYAVNGLNQYTAAGPATFTYDANGNLANDGSTAFVYDAENRLVAASGAKTAALAYDPLGRLWQVTSDAAVTRFLYDDDRLVMEYNGSGAATRSYVHGPGTDEPLVWYDAAAGWARRFLHADHHGSIVALTDDAGNAVAINSYDYWGIPNPGNVGRLGYTGQIWIPELGLWYYKARFYSPTMGRFLQIDPIGYDDNVNLYSYVGNDPINSLDPSGLCETRTGSNVCERTAIRTITTMDGDEKRIYSVEYFKRDGEVIRVAMTSEGIGESYADPVVIVGGIASGIRAMLNSVVRGVGGRVAAGAEAAAAEGGRALALSRFSIAETIGLRRLMGSGEKGAQTFLERTLASETVRLPAGVTRTTLERYIIKVIDAGPRTYGAPSQQMRIQAIIKILERLP